ncbi:MAG: polysaccharide biosynthesis protein [Ignavibacteriae bacterium]|nr:polysaccharide biosynthesis protein [Ignavibacteriota bacterium]
MSIVRATFRSAVWNHAGRVLEYVLMYVTSILIARGLGVQENGRFVGLFSAAMLLMVLSSFGLETSLNKFIPQLGEMDKTERTRFILRRVLLVRLIAVMFVAVAFTAVLMLATTSLSRETSVVLLIVFLFSAVRSIVPLFSTVLTAQLKTDVTTGVNLSIRALELLLVVALAQNGLTVPALFTLFLITSALHVVLYAFLSRSNLAGETHHVELNPIITFGGIYWANTIVDFFLGRQGDILFLGNLLPDTTQPGLYDVAYSISQLATLAMTTGLSGVTLATFARLALTGREAMDKFYSFSVRIVSLLTIPFTAFMLFNSGPLISVLYSGDYLQATVLVQGMMCFKIVSRLFAGGENAEYMLSEGRVGTLVLIGLAAAATNILLNILLIPSLQATGSVIASGTAALLANVLGAAMVFRTSAARLQIAYWLKLAMPAILSAYLTSLIVFENDLVMLLVRGIAFLLLFVGSLSVVRPLHRQDLTWFKSVHEVAERILGPFVRKVEPSP